MSLSKKFFFFISVFLISSASVLAFSDLSKGDHHYFPLTYLNYEGVIDGYDDGTVRADDLVNRAELMKMLVVGVLKVEPKMEDYSECFPDVNTQWFAPFVCYGFEKEWIVGYPSGLFIPDQNVNKVEALKIILNAFDIPEVQGATALFSDTAFDDWYSPFLQVAVDKNLMEESGGFFNPTFSRSRGEIALMIARVMQIKHMDDPVYNDWIKAEFETFLYLDELRKAEGVNEKLVLNATLTKVAREHAKDMAEALGELSHEGSDGSQSYDRIKGALPSDFTGRTGENVGRSTGAIFDAIKRVHDNIFMPEPDDYCNHRTTILGTCLPFSEVGIGVYVKDGFTYFTQDFITTEYVDVLIRDLDQLEVPADYTIGNGYSVTSTDEYSYSTVNSCDGKRVRMMNWVSAGIYIDGAECGLWELAVDPNAYQLLRDVDADLATKSITEFFFEDWSEPEKDRISIYGSNGWQLDADNFTVDVLDGDVANVTFDDGAGILRTFNLDYSESGWLTVTEL